MSSSVTSTTLLFTLVLGLCLVSSANAFGAGEIPAYSELAKTAYRHGTIEQVLETMSKVGHAGGPNAGAVLKGIAGALLGGGAAGLGDAIKGGGGSRFTGLDVKRVYFGNWLRDYSQAMDIAGLSKLTGDSIQLLVMCLGFMAFGYATDEFEITKEKLGVYLCTEHIDNPKGYGEGSDARQYDPRLRPPVEDRELEIDEQNGMKKYIASDDEGFDTSTKCIRRHLEKCIELGRNGGESDKFEAYRELGTALHTLEDFLAHSNYLELALNNLGNREVFCHVGDNVRIRSPNGQNVPPLVTGTFGSSDFMISVLGEVNDKLSSSTVDDLNGKFSDAKKQQNSGNNGSDLLKNLLNKIPSGSKDEAGVNNKIANVEEIRRKAVNIDPDSIASAEVQKIFIDVLSTRDDIFKSIEGILETLGLDDLIEELSNALAVLVLTTIQPYMEPIISKVTEGITTGSEHILKGEDQTVVFDDDNASDPTHSVLSKDHFDLWLNEPAGLAAVAVVKHTVPLIVEAWSDHNAPVDRVIDTILEAIHHPYWARDDSAIQNEMLDVVRRWLGGLDQRKRTLIISSLSKDSVRAGNNKREDSASYGTLGHRCGAGGGHGHAQHAPGSGSAYTQGALGSGGRQHHQTLATGNRISGNPIPQQSSQYGHQSSQYGQQGGQSQNRYGSAQHEQGSYGSSGGAGQAGTIGGAFAGMANRFERPVEQSEDRPSGYGGSAGRRHDDDDESRNTGYGGRASGGNTYGRPNYEQESTPSYGRHEQPGQQQHTFGSPGYGQASSESRYGQSESQDRPSYGQQSGGRRDDDDDNNGRRHSQQQYDGDDDRRGNRRQQQGGQGYGQQEHAYGREDQPAYGRSEGGRRHKNDDDDDNDRQSGNRFGAGQQEGRAGYGGREEYQQGGRRRDDTDDDRTGASQFGRMSLGEGRGGRRDDDDDERNDRHRNQGFGEQTHGYGGRRKDGDDGNNRFQNQGHSQQSHGYGGRRNDDDGGSDRIRNQGYGEQSHGYDGRRNDDGDNDYERMNRYGS